MTLLLLSKKFLSPVKLLSFVLCFFNQVVSVYFSILFTCARVLLLFFLLHLFKLRVSPRVFRFPPFLFSLLFFSYRYKFLFHRFPANCLKRVPLFRIKYHVLDLFLCRFNLCNNIKSKLGKYFYDKYCDIFLFFFFFSIYGAVLIALL